MISVRFGKYDAHKSKNLIVVANKFESYAIDTSKQFTNLKDILAFIIKRGPVNASLMVKNTALDRDIIRFNGQTFNAADYIVVADEPQPPQEASQDAIEAQETHSEPKDQQEEEAGDDEDVIPDPIPFIDDTSYWYN